MKIGFMVEHEQQHDTTSENTGLHITVPENWALTVWWPTVNGWQCKVWRHYKSIHGQSKYTA